MGQCMYVASDGVKCENSSGGKRKYCSKAHKQAAYRLRQTAAHTFQRETLRHRETQLSQAVQAYHYVIGDQMQQEWREKGYLTAQQRAEELDYYKRAYNELQQDYRKVYGEYIYIYHEMIELRQRVDVLEDIVKSQLYWREAEREKS
jgi:uncharacterized protein YutD